MTGKDRIGVIVIVSESGITINQSFTLLNASGGKQEGGAVIGGLVCATIATLVFVPAVFSLLHGRRRPAGPATPEPAA